MVSSMREFSRSAHPFCVLLFIQVIYPREKLLILRFSLKVAAYVNGGTIVVTNDMWLSQ
jgi:hypothetical protein